MPRLSRYTLVVLPLAQIVLATALTIHNFSKPLRSGVARWEDADRQLCDAINAPAAVARYLMTLTAEQLVPNYASVEAIIETVVFFALVGLLWYLAVVEVRARARGFSPTSGSGVRILASLFGLVFGCLVIAAGLVVRRQFGPATAYSTLLALAYFLWGLAIAAFYGTDLLARRRAVRVSGVSGVK